jgi:hypothetical protein
MCWWGALQWTAGGDGDSARTFGVVAAELEEAVENEAGAHGVADQDDRPVAVAARHQCVRQQHPRLLRAVQRHHPRVVYHLREAAGQRSARHTAPLVGFWT